MWCGKCQADVAAEVSSNNQRVFCTVCGTLLSMIDAPPNRPASDRSADKTKDARELLQRWSSGQVLDPFGPPNKLVERQATAPTVVEKQAAAATAVPEASSQKSLPTIHLAEVAPANVTVSAPAEPVENRSRFIEPLPSTAVVQPLEPTAVSSKVSELQTPVAITTVNHTHRVDSTSTPDALPRPSESSTVHRIDAPLVRGTDGATNQFGPSLTSARQEPVPPPLPNPLAPAVGKDQTSFALPASPFLTANTSAAATPVHRRVDAAHPRDHFLGTTSNPLAQTTELPSAVSPPARKPKEGRWPLAWLPSWDPAVWRTETTPSGSWSTAAGQMLAYLGVLGLTAGACMVVWSYFGGPTNYMATGWLIATAGQMMLFFGVVTLVSGGLEQTTDQVNKRIELLGDHIIRIEQAAREMSLRGHVPPAHFGREQDSSTLSRNERAVVEE